MTCLASAVRAEQGAGPTDAQVAASLQAIGLASRPVCFLSAVDFPYKPSGFGLFAPEVQVAEQLSRLGLLIMRRDAGGMNVRFDLTDAGKAAWNSGEGSAERGFCAGNLVVSDIRRGPPQSDPTGRTVWPVTFTAKMVPNPRATWARQPDAVKSLPDLRLLPASERNRFEVQVGTTHLGLRPMTEVKPIR